MFKKLKRVAARAFRGVSHTFGDNYREILDAANTGVFEWDLDERQIYGTRRTFKILRLNDQAGWIDDEKVLANIPVSEQDRIISFAEKYDPENGPKRIETYCLDEHGNKVFLVVHGKIVFDEKGNYRKMLGAVTDVSEQKKLEHRLRHEALHDFLTGLPNRTLLVDRIQHILTRLRRDSDLSAALLFMDIDNFKAINDNLGHGFGDDVLVSIGERLNDAVRAADTVSRIGSDEFVILLEDPTTSKIAQQFADRLLETLHKPLRVQNKVVNLTFSIGLVLIDDPEVSVEALLGDADIAMYAAKDSGKGQVVPFDSSMRTQAAKRLDIETALRQAIDKNELFLVYQPIFSLTSPHCPKPVGVEALLRWTKSDRGNIAPGELLAVAEENGLIEDIGLWVIRTACEQRARWLEKGYPDNFFVNINLSSRHFDNHEIVDYLITHVDNAGLKRDNIRVEVVESAVIRNPDKALNVIESLRDEGVFVSIDDFGTGFSSLSYLHRFPFYSLKIDRSFIIDVIENKASQDIITAIIVMARKLGIKVVAEGVETEEQLHFLESAGCELVQGFLLARPEGSIEVDRIFEEQKAQALGFQEPIALAQVSA